MVNLGYQPNTQFMGNDAFTWSASDGVLYATAPMPQNDAPTVVPPPTTGGFGEQVAENAVLAFSTDDFANNFSPAQRHQGSSGG